ncbi:phytanoyl-CoA dioxygenase family protein [Erythrobacter aureus]|uniref:Phytanoyl-CoA dioxygenase family protein n=1 Tax=Erythrobacter aureus TaxID=2182384 RepID=A0A345YBM0_9SPHN|nr:phytanoyl-CoA dioxygenase family protein [Erythrobacter aureus]AXK41322.1 phytanoyl-CoA dioxygenase family protein [Erythrobacter aureus]
MGETISESWSQGLSDDGYCLIPDLVPLETIDGLKRDLDPALSETPFCIGDFYGHRTKRVGRLPRRSAFAIDLILNPTILALAQKFLGSACDRIQLNVAQLIEIHPGEIEQFPHRDHDMWPIEKNGAEFLLNVMWPLDPFTEENGATRIYPRSHRLEVEELDQLGSPIAAVCNPGAAICFLGSTVHGAGANLAQKSRRAVVIGYSLGWLKPHENPSLAYPPDIAKHFPAELAELTGYVQHRPNLGNYEGQCPSLLLQDMPGMPSGAKDALRPDQAEAVGAFAQSRRSG